MSSLRAPAAIAVLSLALTGCAGGSADLEGRTFTATEVRGHDLVEGSAITLAFEDGQVSANAGCNTIFGEAQWDGGTLEAEQLAFSVALQRGDGRRVRAAVARNGGKLGLSFGNGASTQPTDTLFFAAGPNDESHGLYGRIEAIGRSSGY